VNIIHFIYYLCIIGMAISKRSLKIGRDRSRANLIFQRHQQRS